MIYLALNDTVTPAAQASLPVATEGLRYGSGCFETIAFCGGSPRFWQRHCERFIRSCVRLGIAPKTPPRRLRELVDELAARNGIRDGVLRLSAHQDGSAADTVLTLGPPRHANLPAAYSLLVGTIPHPGPGPLSGIKHNNYAHFLAAHAQAALAGFDEAVLTDTAGKLLEGSRTNLFLLRRDLPQSVRSDSGSAVVRNGLPQGDCGWVVQTAPLIRGVLPGIMRGLVLEAAEQLGCRVLEDAFDQTEALNAEAFFATNALIGIMPVAQLGDDALSVSDDACEWIRSLRAAIAQTEA